MGMGERERVVVVGGGVGWMGGVGCVCVGGGAYQLGDALLLADLLHLGLVGPVGPGLAVPEAVADARQERRLVLHLRIFMLDFQSLIMIMIIIYDYHFIIIIY